MDSHAVFMHSLFIALIIVVTASAQTEPAADSGDQAASIIENGFKVTPHFEMLSAKGYSGRSVSHHTKPEQDERYLPGSRSATGETRNGGIQKAPTDLPAPAVLKDFDSFNNTKPENDGNCLEAINRERVAVNVPALELVANMSSLAARHSAYMAATHLASHDGFWSFRFDETMGRGGVGELVVVDDMLNSPNGPAKRAVDRWMGSAEHKLLLIRPDMKYCGCSVTEGNDGQFYATALVASD